VHWRLGASPSLATTASLQGTGYLWRPHKIRAMCTRDIMCRTPCVMHPHTVLTSTTAATCRLTTPSLMVDCRSGAYEHLVAQVDAGWTRRHFFLL